MNLLNGSLKLITAPTVEPMSLANVKAFLKVEHTDDDNLINELIRTVRKQAERFTKRHFMTQTWDWIFSDMIPQDPFEIPGVPLQSITGIFFTNATTEVEGSAIDTTKYLVEANSTDVPGRVILKAGQQWGNESVRDVLGTRIRFVSGYGATVQNGAAAGSCPDEITLALYRAIAVHYEHRDDLVVGSIVAELPETSKSLLRPFRIMRV